MWNRQARSRNRHRRQTLHVALSEKGNPTLEVILKVTKALWLHPKIEEAPLADCVEA